MKKEHSSHGNGRLRTGQSVRFTELQLALGDEAFRRRFQGRVGQVAGYRLGAECPIIEFRRDGRRPEVRLFEVSPRSLEIVEEPA